MENAISLFYIFSLMELWGGVQNIYWKGY